MKKTNEFLHNFMNRFLKTAAVLLAGSLIFSGIVSCSLEEEDSAKIESHVKAEGEKTAYLVLSATTATRALYPAADENNLVNLALYYKKASSSSSTMVKICEFEDYNALIENSSLALSPDKYCFKLIGKIDSSEFVGEINNIDIVKGKNELNFTLKQTSLGTGKGEVTYTVTFPSTDAAGVKAVMVSGLGVDVKALVPVSSGTNSDSKKNNSTWAEAALSVKRGQFTYNATNVPAGSYKVYVSFYADTEYNSEITKYPETVNVSSGLSTTGTYAVTADNLNQIYSINYVLGDGDFVSGYIAPEKYTRMDKGTLALPAASDVQNHARMLIGWSTENDVANSNIITDPAEIAEVQVISSVDTSELKDITLYAKWFNGYVIDTAKNAEVLDSLNLSTATGKYQLMVKGAATSSTLTSLNTIVSTAPAVPASGTATCQVMLSLTDTTGLTTIGTQFKGNAKLAGLTIPSTVTSIDPSAFNGCTALKILRFEDGTADISLGCKECGSSGKGLFYDCPLTSLYLGRNVNYKKYSDGYEYSDEPSYYGYSAFANIFVSKSDKEDFEVEIGPKVTSIPMYLLYNCPTLTKVTVSSAANITSIGEYAFYNGKKLAVFDIPSSVATIGQSAFAGCSVLASISIPAATTSIGNYAFTNCTSLKNLRFEDGDKDIFLGCKEYVSTGGKGLFYDCPLTTLYLGRNVTYKKYPNGSDYSSQPSYYGYSAFANIQQSKSFAEDLTVTIGEKVSSIPVHLLRNCQSLSSVTIDSNANIASIGESAFYNGKKLATFDIPSTVTTIGESAFSGCSVLASISIPAATTSIGNYAFTNCTSLNTLRFEDGVASISLGCKEYGSSGKGLFYDCPLTSLYLGRNVTYKIYPNGSDYSSQPSYYGYSAFANIQQSKSFAEDLAVTIGEKVTSIPVYLLRNCQSLSSVTIDSNASIASIGDYAFYNGKKLATFDIPSTVTTIGEYAFYSCSSLASISIPAATTSIGHFAFNLCSSLKILRFEDGVASISLGCKEYGSSGKGLFYDCPLTSLYLGRNVTYKKYSNGYEYSDKPSYYGFSAFAYIQSSTTDKEDFNVMIGKYVTSIPIYLLYSSQTLKSVTISSEANITSIGDYAFYNGKKLATFDIPSTVTTIGEYAFYCCSSLASISIPAATTSIGHFAFNLCSSLKILRFEDGVASISLGCKEYGSSGKGLFYDCPLTSLYLGRNVTYKKYSNGFDYSDKPSYYGYSAFARITKLSDVTVSSSVTSLRNDIFFGCSGIKKLTLAEASSDEESATLSLGNNNNDTGLFSAPTALEEFYLGRSLSFTGEPFRKTGGTSISTKVTIGENFTDIPIHTFYMLNLADGCQMTALGTKHWYRASSTSTGYTGGTEITADVTVSANAKAEFIGDSTYNNAVHRYYRLPD